MATFTSSLESIGAWRATRLPLARYVPLAALLAWAAACGGEVARGPQLAMAALAFGLIAQFRLWDDLVDRSRDRASHPGRVLARADSPAPFLRAAVALAAINALGLAMLRGWPAAIGLIALGVALGAWYRYRLARDLVHTHVLLLKYPVLVGLLAPVPAQAESLLLAAAALYAALCAFDLYETPRQTRAVAAALFAHSIALSAIPLLARWSVGAIAASALLAVLLAVAAYRCWRGRSCGNWRYAPFLAAAAGLCFLTAGELP
jgi:hypothetical protein